MNDRTSQLAGQPLLILMSVQWCQICQIAAAAVFVATKRTSVVYWCNIPSHTARNYTTNIKALDGTKAIERVSDTIPNT
jgi:hypothetical protein